MSELQLPPLSLYIHIPWCARKCPYCDFNSHESKQALPEAAYIDALLLDLDADLHWAQGRCLRSIFIGGGTPSLFSANAIKTLLREVEQRIAFQDGLEITLEANPGTAEADKFHGFAEAGINRLSLGIQSLDDDRLTQLGRIHDADQALLAIEMAQGLALESINVDLMHGLPGQSAASAHRDLLTATSYRVPHISWYQLTIEPNTVFHTTRPKLPPEHVLAEIQGSGESLLPDEGYRQYEVSAWAQQGHRCLHNLNYWHFGDYLGIGAGAHGKLTDIRSGQVVRVAKQRQPERYLKGDVQGFRAGEKTLNTQDLCGEFLMNALRLNDGFMLAEFSKRTGLDPTILDPRLESLVFRDLVHLEEGRLRCSDLGRRFLDAVVAEFF